MRRRSNKPCGAEPSVHGRIHSVFRKAIPLTLACTSAEKSDSRNGGKPEHFNPGLWAKSVFQEEMGPCGGNRLGTGFLPGGDHYVGYPVALAGQAAFGVGFTVEAGAQVV